MGMGGRQGPPTKGRTKSPTKPSKVKVIQKIFRSIH